LVAYLFDADHASFGSDYGSPCEQKFLEAIAASGAIGSSPMRVKRGDILARNLASKLQRFSVETKSSLNKYASQSMVYATDMRALATVIGDLADSLGALWHTVDVVEIPDFLAGRNVYCLSLFPVDIKLATFIDNQLRRFEPYLGATQADLGNPVHMEVFFRLLDCVYFAHGTMVASRWDTDEGVYTFGERPEKFFELRDQSFWEYSETAPKLPGNSSTSTRGMDSVRRLREVTKPTHFEQVAQELQAGLRRRVRDHAFDFTLLPPSVEQLKIPVDKLLKYSLNPEHPDGKHKAHLFSELLEIRSDQWRLLAYQLAEGLHQAHLDRVRSTEHGIQYTGYVPVVGTNGLTYVVETGWIIRPGEPAQLTTAYPASKERQRSISPAKVPWIPLDLTGKERWAALYEAADARGREAAKNTVPKPMKIVGAPIAMEGMCGYACIRLPGTSSFARWLRAEGIADKAYGRPGVEVPAVRLSQSVDRAESYANAFARVLWLNGIDNVTTESRLD